MGVKGVMGVRAALIVACAGVVIQVSAETILKATDVAPADLLENPSYKIDDEVVNDGFMNTYFIRSEYGNFEPGSDRLLRIRAREVDALDRLASSSKTGVVVGAAVDSLVAAGKSPFIMAHRLATAPIATVTGIPGGVARTFGRFFRGAKGVVTSAGGNASDEGSGESNKAKAVGFAEGWLRITSAERSWAKDLQIDPYTTNEVMAAALKEVARYDAAGNFATSLAVPGMGAIKVAISVTDMVWEMHPADLKKLNHDRLVEFGVARETVEAFDDARWISPSVQTAITNAILQLGGVENLDALIGLTANLESEVEALFLMESIDGVVWYHTTRRPVARIVSGPTVPVFVDSDGRIVSPLALDYVTWNAQTAKAWETVLDEAGDNNAIYVSGHVEPTARAELEKRGWSVTDHQSFEIPAAD